MRPQYLLRFDDICPTMNWSIWEPIEEALVGAGVKPVLAVVPDNQDPTLKVSDPDRRFWDRVRAWQARGWSIGLHGYQHLHTTADGGILRFSRWSEFSGLSFQDQRFKLQRACDVFASHGVRPDVWIAPAHSFDAVTLQALKDIGICCLSDGFSLYPYRDSNGMMWVPQQLWHFRPMPFGLWTVCLHANRWTLADVDCFRSHLREFASVITSWSCVTSVYEGRRRSLMDGMFSAAYPRALKLRKWLGTFGSANGS